MLSHLNVFFPKQNIIPYNVKNLHSDASIEYDCNAVKPNSDAMYVNVTE